MKIRRNASTTVAAAAVARRRSAFVDRSSGDAGLAGRRSALERANLPTPGNSNGACDTQLASPARPVTKKPWTSPTAHSPFTPKIVTCPEEAMSISRLRGNTSPASSAIDRGRPMSYSAVRMSAGTPPALAPSGIGRSRSCVGAGQPMHGSGRKKPSGAGETQPSTENGANCRGSRARRAASNCLLRSSNAANGSHWKR
jgi:hypothetical protein